ncbi:MAG TPA: GWxTD domain-containing protein [Edaphobacter sp.]|jgi:GWxTD domain-containing protein|nr:GWxTD domain-containing protein [Edaphobacter sp.]
MRRKRLCGYKENPVLSRLTSRILLAAVSVMAVLSTVTLARGQSNTGTQPALKVDQTSQLGGALYRKWLEEDVRWIITPEEKARFSTLSSNNERNEFIRQFWQQRNVKVNGVPGDSFRTEHYRRIAYANQHFAHDEAGWRTDRGRALILYGRPDSMDTHLVTRGQERPYEVWHYQEIQEPTGLKTDVTMKFVDVCSCGDFQLQKLDR